VLSRDSRTTIRSRLRARPTKQTEYHLSKKKKLYSPQLLEFKRVRKLSIQSFLFEKKTLENESLSGKLYINKITIGTKQETFSN
jgi:hypothetical protein